MATFDRFLNRYDIILAITVADNIAGHYLLLDLGLGPLLCLLFGIRANEDDVPTTAKVITDCKYLVWTTDTEGTVYISYHTVTKYIQYQSEPFLHT